MDEKTHYIVVTGIVIKDSKYLLAKRSLEEAAFPGLWTVPGGKLNRSDYENSPKDTPDHWYNVLEKLLQREVKEEVGLKIKNIRYLLSLAYIRSDNMPTLIISLFCDYASGEVRLSKDLIEYAWIDIKELKKYELVPGLREEIELVDKALKEGNYQAWQGKYDDVSRQSVRDGQNSIGKAT
ncbi:NUDIX domain-containing protein [Patescibacteria group bacterium]|nr:NUDIX domain-containing protein [Patescibacteria group bacterium]